MKYEVEMTDTFGGDANYSWVKREVIEADSHKQAITKFKRLHSVDVRHKIVCDGELRRVDLANCCVCIFSVESYH